MQYNSKDEKMKRPERQLYIPPALRSKFDEDCEDKMEYPQDEYAGEAVNRQAYFKENNNFSLRRPTNIVKRRVRFDLSCSYPKGISNNSFKDDDSSDFEESCSESIESTKDKEIMETNENNSNDHWNKEGIGKLSQNNYDIKNFSKSNANKLFDSDSNESELDRGLFFKYDDSSISYIETLIDNHIKKGRVLTSTPNSDVVEQTVLDAAKHDPEEESRLESTLLGQSDVRETTINTNKKKCGYSFEIYQDPSFVKIQSTNDFEIFGNNYIPPPVPPTISAFRLPLIHRLPSPVLSPRQLFVPCQVSTPKIPQLPTQLQQPCFLHIPSPHPSFFPPNSIHLSSVNNVSSPSLQYSRYCAPNQPHASSSSPVNFPQEKFSPYLPHDSSGSQYLHLRSASPQSLGPYKQEDCFYIPPPVPPQQKMAGKMQNRSLNQDKNFQCCQFHSI